MDSGKPNHLSFLTSDVCDSLSSMCKFRKFSIHKKAYRMKKSY